LNVDDIKNFTECQITKFRQGQLEICVMVIWHDFDFKYVAAQLASPPLKLRFSATPAEQALQLQGYKNDTNGC